MTQENPAIHEGASVESTPAPSTPMTVPQSPATPAPTTTGTSDTTAPAAVPPGESSVPATGPSSAPASTTAFDPVPTGTASVDQGAEGDPNRVASTVGEVPTRSLQQMARTEPVDQANREPGEPSPTPADQTRVVVIDGHEAASTPKGETGAFGQALAPSGEVAGGNIAKTLEPPSAATAINQPLTKERAALLSPIGQKLAGFIGRPPAEWGLLGPGDTVRGHMFLLDMHTGEKVRGMDDHRIGEGKLYANIRNFPESLATGDTIEQILGTAAPA